VRGRLEAKRRLRRQAACGVTATVLAVGAASATAAQDIQQLLQAHGCPACHRVDEKLVGPAFRDVAARYKTNRSAVDHLLAVVRDGPREAWGDVPMPPYDEDKISDADLKSIIEWILTQ
jgi:cytochrome c